MVGRTIFLLALCKVHLLLRVSSKFNSHAKKKTHSYSGDQQRPNVCTLQTQYTMFIVPTLRPTFSASLKARALDIRGSCADSSRSAEENFGLRPSNLHDRESVRNQWNRICLGENSDQAILMPRETGDQAVVHIFHESSLRRLQSKMS